MLYLLIGLLLLIVSVAALAQRTAIANQLHDWKVLPQSEPITELYFAEHTQLPSVYTPGASHILRFTVRNLEGRAIPYSYTIMQRSEDGGKRELARGSFRLDDRQTKNAEIPVILSDLGARSQVVIYLTFPRMELGDNGVTEQTQAIHYWVSKVKE